MDMCPSDEPTAKNLVWNKNSSHSREEKKWKNLLQEGALAIGELISILECFISIPYPIRQQQHMMIGGYLR